MTNEYQNLEVLCEDGPLLAVNKPSGMISQGPPPGVECLSDHVKRYLKHKYDKPGNVYLGVIHRLDRPVSGVTVFSRNSKCAARLCEQFAQRNVTKTYLAVVEGTCPAQQDVLEDWLYRFPDQSRVEVRRQKSPDTKHARLRYQVLAKARGRSLVRVDLDTGRMHQIRVQFASRGCPVVGDEKYGAKSALANPLAIGLHAWQLTLQHPIRWDEMTIVAPPPRDWKSLGFDFNLDATA